MKTQCNSSPAARGYIPPLCEMLLVRQERSFLLSGEPTTTIPSVEEEELEWEEP